MKKIITLILLLLFCSIAVAQTLPPGSIGSIQCCNSGGTWQQYTYTFTPTTSGSDYVLFAFRQDPAYWNFSNVDLFAAGSNTNLLLNPNFTTGGSVTVSGHTVTAPTHWGVFYQNGTVPSAAGIWKGSGGHTGGGLWYDGAVGSFDGIYQGVTLTAGVTYDITFWAMSTSGTANNSTIQMGIYAGSCANIGLAPSQCSLPSSSGFAGLVTPSQTATVGGVTVVSTNTTNVQNTVVTTGTPTITSTTSNRTVNTTLNGQAVIELFQDTTTTTVTPTTTIVYSTPTTTTTYSDGTSVVTQGTTTVVSTNTVNVTTTSVTQGTTPVSIIPVYTSNITAIEQTRYNSAQSRLYAVQGDSIYISQSLGNNNSIYVTQTGRNESVAGIGQQNAPVQGSNNTIGIRQGDPVALTGANLIELEVYGSGNSLNLNQGYDYNGNYTGLDLAYHYQSVSITGNSNAVITQQQGQYQYGEVKISGNSNNQTMIQTGIGQQLFSAITGNNNLLTTTQTGNAQNFLDVALIGDGNSAVVNQSGTTQNKATISITNAGGPAGVNLTQTGGQVYSISTVCVTAGGCGTVTVKQGP